MKKRIKFFFIGLILSLFFWWGVNSFQIKLEEFFYAQISQPLQEITLVEIPPRPQKPELNLLAESALSVKINNAEREKIIFSENSQKALPIASISKLMTAVLLLENTPQNDYDFSKVVTVSKTAASQEDVPVYGNLKENEAFTVEKLLELMLYYSSNDAAFAISEIVDPKTFVEKMNERAESLGFENTYFVNPTGLDPKDPDVIPNYSTARDLMEFSRYILKNHPLIFEFSLRPGPYPVKNGLSDLYVTNGQKIVGGKTGYTEKAGGCMLLVLEDEKENYFINIILGTDSPKDRVQEMQKLINWINP